MNDMSSVPHHPPPPWPPLPPTLVAFIGERRDFFHLVTRGAGLELVTAGFYRFWLATDIRRHLWSHTVIDGDAAEYTGRGKELLIGFLIAMAILVPIYLAYFLIGIEAERFKEFASFPLILAFYVFGQFAIYRARRYRLTRTIWRGVRFWMDGSGWAYAGRALLWGLLVVLTVGLALPWREAALERYKMKHSWYGDLQGEFTAEPKEFFRRAWGLWIAMPFALILWPLFPLVYAHFKAIEWRWWLSGIRFGGVRLESTLPKTAFTKLYWKIIGWYLLAAVVLSIYSGICTAVAAALGGAVDEQAKAEVFSSISFLVAMGIGYLGLVLSLNVLVRLYLMRDVWALVLQHVQVRNIEAAANVAAKGELATALGEGFADGLDVAGF